jgi:hypothetical protein
MTTRFKVDWDYELAFNQGDWGPYNEGQIAFLEGKNIHTNPHYSFPKEEGQWKKGWKSMEKAHKDWIENMKAIIRVGIS